MMVVTWCRAAIEDDWSQEFWELMAQYPSHWDRHHDIVQYEVPDPVCTWLALTWPQEWQRADVEPIEDH